MTKLHHYLHKKMVILLPGKKKKNILQMHHIINEASESKLFVNKTLLLCIVQETVALGITVFDIEILKT